MQDRTHGQTNSSLGQVAPKGISKNESQLYIKFSSFKVKDFLEIASYLTRPRLCSEHDVVILL